MMMKKICLLPILLFVLLFTACNESEDPGKYDNWQARNEAFIDSLQQVVDSKSDPALKQQVYGRDKSIALYYKIKESGPTVTMPGNKPVDPAYWTSKVEVFYRGMLINEEAFAQYDTPYYTTLYTDDDIVVFDQNFTTNEPLDIESPTLFTVNTGIISGWTEILQLMRPGDRFEVYIPYQLAYGTAANGSIPAYSTLIFDIKMHKIHYYPK